MKSRFALAVAFLLTSTLGLAVAQTLIAQNHGTIDCESQPGHTVFSIFLPLPT